MNGKDPENQKSLAPKGEPEQVTRAANIMGTELPPDVRILRRVRVMAADRKTRISDLAYLLSLDPVTILELLKVANAIFFAGDRPPITNVQTALVRLGSESIIQLLDSLLIRPQIQEPDVSLTFASLRTMSRRIASSARIIAQISNRDIADLAFTAGSMSYIGHMVACIWFGSEYATEAGLRKRTALAYRFQQSHNVDINVVQLDYLRNHGLPQIMFYGLDRELKCKTPAQAALRFIIESSNELVDAHKEGRWDKYIPNRQLPSKSAIRLLQLTEQQYEQVYEQLNEYLTNSLNEPEIGSELPVEAEAESPVSTDTTSPSQQTTVSTTHATDEKNTTSPRPKQPTKETKKPKVQQEHTPKEFVWGNKPLWQQNEILQTVNFIDPDSQEALEEQKELGPEAQKVLQLIKTICDSSQTSQELLSNIMQLLTNSGPFSRAALIELTGGRQTAEIHISVGGNFEGGDSVDVKDPLSPLALCLTKIRSFNSATIEDLLSPFGISSYAISPLRIKSAQPVLLYADCGLNQPLSLAARKIFRLVVGLLNKTLPGLPGGLPKRMAPAQ